MSIRKSILPLALALLTACAAASPVERGTVAGLPPLRVLLWVGDNIQDFPRLGQELKERGGTGAEDFGVRYFLVPNPMYGSWEGRPSR